MPGIHQVLDTRAPCPQPVPTPQTQSEMRAQSSCDAAFVQDTLVVVSSCPFGTISLPLQTQSTTTDLGETLQWPGPIRVSLVLVLPTMPFLCEAAPGHPV